MSDVSEWNRKIIEEFQANKGKVGGPFANTPLLLLHTTGAKTGRERINPLMFLDLDEHRYVFATRAGHEANPDWYLNLVAHPEVTVEAGSGTYQAAAVPLTGGERDRIYAEQARRNSGFAEYQKMTSRIIPVVELIPKG